MRFKLYTLIIIAAAAATISSCRKSDRDTDTETQSSVDNSVAENAFNDVYRQLHEAASLSPEIYRIIPGNPTAQAFCGTITVSPSLPDTTFPKTVLINYGSTNVLCSDGNNRRGRIRATFTGKYRDSLSVITITPDSFYLNDYYVQGTKTITNKGRNSSGNLNYRIVVHNASVTYPTTPASPYEKKVTWNSTRTREWIAGESTPADLADDAYLITGTANGTGTTGNTFSAEITQALRVQAGCRWIVSGKLTLEPQNLTARYIDFGAGGCDNIATVTVNGNAFEIQMK